MIKLVIFDVDGVVLDSESLYLESALINAEINHYDIPYEILKSVIGTGIENHGKVISSYMGEGFDFENYYTELRQVRDKKKEEMPPLPKKGLLELLEYLKAKGIAMAIATSTTKDRQLHDLQVAGIDHYFDYMVFGDDIIKHKPDPEIYLKVLDHYGFKNDEVLIIEDSINGILSGTRAGVRVIYIPDQVDVPEEIEELAYKKVDDLSRCKELIEEIDKV